MNFITSNFKVCSMLIDLSASHFANDGRRVVDHLKESLIEFIRSEFDDDDIFYLYQQDSIQTVNRVGEQVGIISNYEIGNVRDDLRFGLQQSIYVSQAEGDDLEKYFLLFTDKIDSVSVKKLIKTRDRIDPSCKIVVFFISNSLFQEDLEIVMIDNVEDILFKIKENVKYGR